MQHTSSYDNDADYNDDFAFSSAENAESLINLTVPLDLAGARLDAALAKLLPDYSRSRLAGWIKEGLVKVDGEAAVPKYKLIGGEALEIRVQPDAEAVSFAPEAMDLAIVYEDEAILVVNKPAGLVVHPAAGNWQGTLLNGLLHYCPDLATIPRAGIVHRLDKDTSGLMVVAKTLSAQHHLVQQLQARTVSRVYRAVADGVVPFNGKIDAPIGRDPYQRVKMAVVKFGGKEAITHIAVLERYASHTYIECRLETGRTHQIRVHMREANHPLTGDPVYGNPRHDASEAVRAAVKALSRQALHAYRLKLRHPISEEEMQFEAPLPDDLYHLLSVLRLENGMDSALSHEEAWQERLPVDDDEDDWDDGDVEVVYVRD